eukprot:TRINITY_DN5264_c2_g1_i1.p1 TRINITY_DN5264_c2_g1~~TRINITY_DN5264_c2_g1_i1.p1  ORF type:complete len:660 (-),score=80.98 TRINITY_DN5264_c2_g1_i1:328-2169(-)
MKRHVFLLPQRLTRSLCEPACRNDGKRARLLLLLLSVLRCSILPGAAQEDLNGFCWHGGYDAEFCCECNFPGCFPGKAGARLRETCCGPSTAINETLISYRERLCTDMMVDCVHRGDLMYDPACREVVDYVGSLGPKCWHRVATTIQGCARGIALASWAYWRYRRPHVDRSYDYPASVPVGDPASGTRVQTRGEARRCLEDLQRLRHAYKLYSLVDEEVQTSVEPEYFKREFVAHLHTCLRARARDLKSFLDTAKSAFHGNPSDAAGATLKSTMQGPRIGVIIAVAPKDRPFYANTLDMWQCYCKRHGDCEVILDGEDFLNEEEYPEVVATDFEGVVTKRGKAWNRWFALRRYLDRYEWLFTADPDQFISRECFRDTPLSAALRDVDASAQVVMRDFARFQTLNSAGVFFRRGDGSRLFIDLLISKIYWLGLLDFDQSAFDQTVLEFVELFFTSAPDVPRSQVVFSSPLCLVRQSPGHDGQASLQGYFQCWHDLMEGWLGDLGNRRTTNFPLHLVDPRTMDFNYVVGGRSRAQAPLVWHLAGRDKFMRNEDGYSVLDGMLTIMWNLTRFPNVGQNESGTDQSCQFWVDSARDGACSGGTELLDCREGTNLAMC